MTYRKAIPAMVLATCVFGAGGAAAEITAEQVWDSMRSLAESYGETVTGTLKQSGDTLTVSDITVSSDIPEAEISAKIGMITFTELGDGTVEISTSAQLPVKIMIDPADGEAVSIGMTFGQDGMTTIVGGSPDNLSYDLAANEVSLAVSGVSVDGEEIDMDMLMSLSDLTGKYLVAGSDTRMISANLSAARGNIGMSVVDPETNGSFDMKIGISDIRSASNSTVPPMQDAAGDMAAMLRAGFETKGTFDYGPLTLALEFADKNENGQVQGSTEGGGVSFDMSGKSMSYESTQRGVQFTISGSGLPLPQVSATIAETAFRLLVPMTPGDTADDFALHAAYKGVSVSDMIWGMFDPDGVLPRDPATILFDLSGKVKLLVDFLDPELSEADLEMPGEVQSLNLNAVEVTIAGASLTGDGAFTFDNTDLTTFDGIPKPVGTANFKLVGGNGLIDNLIAMGLLPEDQAMGFRMMLGLFARPGDGEDTLVSEISVTEDGSVLANGQRLR